MTTKRKEIRQNFKALLKAGIDDTDIQANRAYEHENYPSINLVSGPDDPVDEGYAGNQQARIYSINAELRVASSNHDDDLDDLSQEIKTIVQANRKSLGDWSFCYVGSYGEPETDAGDVVYSMMPMEIIFMYED